MAPFPTRARDKAPVAVPIEWGERDLGVRADQFRGDGLMKRFDHLDKDPRVGFRKSAKALPKLK